MGKTKNSNSTFSLKQSAKQRSRKPLVIGLVVLAVLLVSGSTFAYFTRSDAPPDQSSVTTTASEQTADTEVTDSKDTPGATPGLPENTSSTTKQSVPESSQVSVQITSVSQQNQTVNAAAAINGTTQAGTCVFTYTTADDRPVVRQVASSNQACQTQVPEVEFAKTGSWNLNVTFYVNNTRSEANQNVTIN